MTAEKRNDSIRSNAVYRAIVILMALDVVLGAGIAAIGYVVLQDLAISLVGAGLATCGIVLLVFFELFGRRGR